MFRVPLLEASFGSKKRGWQSPPPPSGSTILPLALPPPPPGGRSWCGRECGSARKVALNEPNWLDKSLSILPIWCGILPLNISATWGCCVLYTVKKINWWRYCLALWRNFRPFPSVWRNLTSHRIELCNTVQSSVKYSEIRQNLFNSVFSGGTVEVLQLFHTATQNLLKNL